MSVRIGVGLVAVCLTVSLLPMLPTRTVWAGDPPKDAATAESAVERSAPAMLHAPFDEPTAKAAQQHRAIQLNRDVLQTNSIGMKLVLIPPGQFRMGSNEDPDELLKHAKSIGLDYATREWYSDATPSHKVRITKPFDMGIYTVTRGQFRQFAEAEHYKTEPEKDNKGGYGLSNGKFEQRPEFNWQHTGFEQTDEHPVVNVNWNDANAFCDWLSRKEGAKYRLPTEAEWEYACRAGTTTRFYNGDDFQKLAEVANVSDVTVQQKFPWFKTDSSISDGYEFTAPVGKFNPNAFGLFDMHGNVCQWCQDKYGLDYYMTSPVDDPQGPMLGNFHVLRGGCWSGTALDCRSADRGGDGPLHSSCGLGFRVVRER